MVIGAGAGGAPLALRLGELGLRVLLVEAGVSLPSRPRVQSEPIGDYISDVMGSRVAALSLVGGATKFYGAALYRMRESDFCEVEHEAGLSPAWPLTYAELEPYYEQAETLFRVHGSPAGDPSEPPRSKPYPHPPIPHSSIVASMVQRLERSGTCTSFIPTGIDYGAGRACELCATCDAYHCSIDAKMDAEIAAVRPALATGNVQLTTQTECRRVLTDSDGARATGVLLSRGGAEYVVQAEIVAVCGGLSGTAAILRRSRTERHSEGLGNDNGVLGRYLAGHSTGLIFPFVSWKPVPQAHTKTFAINEFYEGAPDWPFPLGAIQVLGQMPYWRDVSKLKQPFAKLISERSVMCSYMTEAVPAYEAGFVFEGDEITRSHRAAAQSENACKTWKNCDRSFPARGVSFVHPLWPAIPLALGGDGPVRRRSRDVGSRPELPGSRRQRALCGRRLRAAVSGGGQHRVDHLCAGPAGRRSHRESDEPASQAERRIEAES